MGDGGGEPRVLQPANGLVDPARRPVGDGERLQPVEEGHVGQEPKQLAVHGDALLLGQAAQPGSVKSFMFEVTACAASVGWGSDVGVGEAVEVALSPGGGGVGVSDSPQAPASTATAAITSVTNRYLVIL